MGRVKLKIKRLESNSNRQVTYSKRRNGILKKSKELSILCDIDLILLMFSPTGKPTLLLGENSNIDEVIAKFAQLTPQERNKRKLESLEALKRTFKKLDHDLNIQDFLGPSTQSVEELSNQVRILQAQITQVHRGLSFWSNPDKICNIEHLKNMEDSLRESLNRIEVQKESFAKPPLISLECSSQFQNGMHLPLMMGAIQESPTLSWLPNNEYQHTILSGELNFLPQRDVECSGYPSLQKCSGLFGHGKTNLETTSQADNARKEGGVLNDLDTAACLRLQLNEQYPYQPYSSLDLPEVKNLMPNNLQGHPLDFQLNSSFQLPRPMYDNVQHTWFPTSEPYHFNVQ